MKVRGHRWAKGRPDVGPPPPMAVLGAVDPDSGVRESGLITITLTGENFLVGDTVYLSANADMLGGRALLTNFQDSETILANNVNLIEAAGDYFIALRRGGEYSNTVGFDIENPAPPAMAVIDSINPDSAVEGEELDIVVTGSNFLAGDVIVLTDGASEARSLTTQLDSATQMTANDVTITEDPGDWFIEVRRDTDSSNQIPFTVTTGQTYDELVLSTSPFAYYPYLDLVSGGLTDGLGAIDVVSARNMASWNAGGAAASYPQEIPSPLNNDDGGVVVLYHPNSNVWLNNPPGFRFEEQVSLAAWIECPEFLTSDGLPNTNYADLIKKGAEYNLITRYNVGDGTHHLVSGITGDDGAPREITGPTIETNTLYFIGMTYDGSTHRLYLNDEIVASAVYPGAGLFASTFTNFAVVNYSGGGGAFNGMVGKHTIWNRAITQAEMLSMYEKGVPDA